MQTLCQTLIGTNWSKREYEDAYVRSLQYLLWKQSINGLIWYWLEIKGEIINSYQGAVCCSSLQGSQHQRFDTFLSPKGKNWWHYIVTNDRSLPMCLLLNCMRCWRLNCQRLRTLSLGRQKYIYTVKARPVGIRRQQELGRSVMISRYCDRGAINCAGEMNEQLAQEWRLYLNHFMQQEFSLSHPLLRPSSVVMTVTVALKAAVVRVKTNSKRTRERCLLRFRVTDADDSPQMLFSQSSRPKFVGEKRLADLFLFIYSIQFLLSMLVFFIPLFQPWKGNRSSKSTNFVLFIAKEIYYFFIISMS